MITFCSSVNFDLIKPDVNWTCFPFDPQTVQGGRFLWTGITLKLRHLVCELPAAGSQEAVSLAERFFLVREMSVVEVRIGEGDLAGITLASVDIPARDPLSVCWNDEPLVIERGEKIAPQLMFHGPAKGNDFPPGFSMKFWLNLEGNVEPAE